jgi:hypothetical protein
VVVAAFLAGGMVQRVIAGEYAIEAGPFKLKQLRRGTLDIGRDVAKLAAAVDAVTSNLKALQDGLVEPMENLAALKERAKASDSDSSLGSGGKLQP